MRLLATAARDRRAGRRGTIYAMARFVCGVEKPGERDPREPACIISGSTTRLVAPVLWLWALFIAERWQSAARDRRAIDSVGFYRESAALRGSPFTLLFLGSTSNYPVSRTI